MDEEYWKPVSDGAYEISNIGHIRNSRNLHVLKPHIDRYGYYKLSYNNYEGMPVYKTVHRLVAEVYILNPNNEPQVNHIDGNKLNNRVENLEWCSPGHNIRHSFDTLLNENTNQVQLIDNADNSVLNFRSIKSLSKHLDMYSSVLIPLIKNSNINKINGRYTVIVKDISSMLVTSNTTNFGIPVYVFDIVDGTLITYPSILLASYFTGIRSLFSVRLLEKCFYKIGYFISFNINEIPKSIDLDKEQVIKDRNEYLNTPYQKRPSKYYLYDYYTKVELVFNTLNEICSYLSDMDPSNGVVKKALISSSLCSSLTHRKTGLVRGYGVRSDLHNDGWFPYTEEIIICSKHKRPVPVCVYRVVSEGKETLIFGMYNLCKYFNYSTDKPIKNVTHKEVLEAINIPNLNITRLNLPIK